MSRKAVKNKKVYPERSRRVFVAMSGGVDSSVAAYLLQKEDYDVTGVFMRCYNLDGCQERDAEDARRVAEHLGIPFYVFDFEEEYKRDVVEYMIQGYREGVTPNPDVMCNKEIKFGLFLKKALSLGADYIATGHYVRRNSFLHHRASIRSSDSSHPTLSLRRFAIGETKPVEAPRVAVKKNSSAFGLFTARDKMLKNFLVNTGITIINFLGSLLTFITGIPLVIVYYLLFKWYYRKGT